MFDARSRPRAEVTHAIGRNECCAPLRIFPHLVPILRSIPRSPSWHADHHSACAACLTCQPVVSSCRGDILPHTTTLERLNRFTNSGDISFTRLVEKVAIFIFHQSEPTHCQHYSYPRTMTSAVFCHPPPHMAIRR